MVTHVQFDFDGTLVNTIDGITKLFTFIAQSHGKELTQTFIDSIPNFGRKLSPFALFESEMGIPLNRRDMVEHYSKFPSTHKFQLLPGVERLVRHLHRHRIPMAVATGNFSTHYLGVTKTFGDFFPVHFTHAVCGHDDPEVTKNKPGPQIYQICANRFTDSPVTDMNKVLIFEDSITGLIGAVASGAKTVLVATKQAQESKIFLENESLLKQATLVIESMEQFRPELFGLPPFDENVQETQDLSLNNQIGD